MKKAQQPKPETGRRQKKMNLPTISATSNQEKIGMHDLLGDKLRAYYDQVAREPVPDRFAQLLKELEDKGKQDQN